MKCREGSQELCQVPGAWVTPIRPGISHAAPLTLNTRALGDASKHVWSIVLFTLTSLKQRGAVASGGWPKLAHTVLAMKLHWDTTIHVTFGSIYWFVSLLRAESEDLWWSCCSANSNAFTIRLSIQEICQLLLHAIHSPYVLFLI